jgi:Sulfate permease family
VRLARRATFGRRIGSGTGSTWRFSLRPWPSIRWLPARRARWTTAVREARGNAAVTGLYAFLAGALVALLFSTSRQLSIGPDSTIAPMMAVGVGAVVAAAGSDYAGRIVLLALIVGVVVLAARVAQLGFLADLLSRPVMSGGSSPASGSPWWWVSSTCCSGCRPRAAPRSRSLRPGLGDRRRVADKPVRDQGLRQSSIGAARAESATTRAPHVEHVPAVARRPFESVTGSGSLIWTGRFSRMQ